MNFKGIRKQYFELFILKFNHSPMIVEKNDLWLNIFINVSAYMGSWQRVDECLTVNEVRTLIQWLRALSEEGNEISPVLYFTEPNLSFYHINTRESGRTIRINFENELRPYDADEETTYYLTCRLTRAQLAEMADDLLYELENCFTYENTLQDERMAQEKNNSPSDTTEEQPVKQQRSL